MSRILSVTWARNEEDIIESSIRHNVQWMEKMIFILHRSTDATHHILERLVAEGLPLEIRTTDTEHHEQSLFSTQILQEFSSADLDWFLPLDADECLSTADHNVSGALQNVSPDTLYRFPYQTYVPTPQDNPLEPSPIHRITHRRYKEIRQFFRLLIPRSLANQHRIMTGGHTLLDAKGNPVPSTLHPSLTLAHFPIRSEVQFRQKIITGWKAEKDRPNRQETDCFHWEALYERCIDDTPILEDELHAIAMRYCLYLEDFHTSYIADPLVRS
ncbi:hypothetical protein COU75_02460 [Candidatus Peregrinibacteria bacterium CG10_big_fil_rev_8_21_14_0_10_42_8]|nr:MAG: hypothetical protein COU75_02460 [Candidatus Peregrinibacteria bacterium CG10_big_fil_rev_8_21_14_0_10_42_8]